MVITGSLNVQKCPNGKLYMVKLFLYPEYQEMKTVSVDLPD